MLRELGVPLGEAGMLGQGFLFGRPRPLVGQMTKKSRFLRLRVAAQKEISGIYQNAVRQK
jgi:hypothetical protein